MSTTSYTRTQTGDYAGLATIGGGVLLLSAFVVDAATGAFTVEGVPASTEWLAAYALLTLGSLLLVGGLAGIAAVYRRTFGSFALAGIVAAAVGFLSVAVGAAMNFLYDGPADADTTGGGLVFLGMLVLALGSLVTGLALLRARMAHSAAGLLVVGVLAYLVGFVVGEGVVDAIGFDLTWTLFGVLTPLGWALFGNYVRRAAETVTSDRVAPVA